MSSGRPTSQRGTLRSITPTSRTSSISGPIPAPSTTSTNTPSQTPMGAWGNGKLKIGGGVGGSGANAGTGAGAGGVGAANGQAGSTNAVGQTGSGSAVGESKAGEVHPLKHDWTFYYVHRPPGAKVIEYEKEIRTVASFGSTESFWTIYSHLLRPSSLPAVTDLLMFASHVRRPVWEELPNGGKWVVRLRKGVADRLWENSLLSLLGDQFDEEDGVVGVVLSVRSQEDILSVWSDRERVGAGSGAGSTGLGGGAGVAEGEERRDGVRDKLIHHLGLPPNTAFDYKSNRALLEGAHTHSSSGGGGNNSNHDRHIERSHHHSNNQYGSKPEREGAGGHSQGYHHGRIDGRERGDHHYHGRAGNANGNGERRGGGGQGYSREDSGTGGAGGGSPWTRR